MKAIVYTEYGPPDVLQFTEVAKPNPKDDEVLIRIRAASVNPLDWHFLRGTPYAVRTMAGLRRPKVTRLGIDVAGQLEAIGRNVTQFKPGDAGESGRGQAETLNKQPAMRVRTRNGDAACFASFASFA